MIVPVTDNRWTRKNLTAALKGCSKGRAADLMELPGGSRLPRGAARCLARLLRQCKSATIQRQRGGLLIRQGSFLAVVETSPDPADRRGRELLRRASAASSPCAPSGATRGLRRQLAASDRDDLADRLAMVERHTFPSRFWPNVYAMLADDVGSKLWQRRYDLRQQRLREREARAA